MNISMHKNYNAKRGAKNKFIVSAGFIREFLTSLLAVFISLWILGFVFDVFGIHSLSLEIIEKIHNNIIVQYPLITTIIGAFIALLCDFFIIHPKLYVSPNAFFAKVKKDKSEKGEKEALKWYIENRSLFDCVDIHVNAFKCTCQNTEGDIRMKKVDLQVSNIPTIAGRWASSNEKAIIVVAKDVTKEEVLEDDFDYIVLVVKVTHALSRVTKIITQQYYRADIYHGVMANEKLFSSEDLKARAEILTLKAGVQKRFMYARKFAGYSMVAIFMTTIMKMVFITDDMSVWMSIYNIVLISACILLILFSCLRVIYKVPVYTNEENDNYMYRVAYQNVKRKSGNDKKSNKNEIKNGDNNNRKKSKDSASKNREKS